MSWTGPICSNCYAAREPGRIPYTMQVPEVERCAFCGKLTSEGIYYRADPKTVRFPPKSEEPKPAYEPPSSDIYMSIAEEVQKQFQKFGLQTHSDEIWTIILGEEFGEACKALLEGSENELVQEITQIAAVCVSWLDAIRRDD